MSQTLYIYGLFQNSTHELFYVGMTRNPQARIAQHEHILNCKKRKKDDCYMGILEKGEALTKDDEAFWIHNMLFLGCKLQNKHLYRKSSDGRIAW